MNIYGQQIIATTLQGLEEVLEKELNIMGIERTEIITRGVTFPYSQANLYKTNMACRVALRILVPAFSFEASGPEDLYQKALQLPWDQFQNANNTFAIFNAINSQKFPHAQYVTLKLKDAICDSFRKNTGKRPNVDTERPDVYWHLHIYENKVTISLDSSGDSLHLRGYRRGHHGAPINEVLAAGLIYLSGWDPQHTPFIDGMCGSGTIAIEAAMLATRRAPNLNRRNFPFRNWADFNEDIYQDIRKQLMQDTRSNPPSIIGYDIQPRAIQTAEMHAKLAGVHKFIKFVKADFLDTKPESNKGVLIMNPPYGERLEIQDLESLYKAIGTTLKHQYPGWRAGIISSNKECHHAVGLNSSNTFHLLNGKLPCDYKIYEMFEGKKVRTGA